MTCDQTVALFNVTKQIFYMKFEDIFKAKERIKGTKINSLASRIDYNEH